jgi:hypothetical protein
MRFFATALADAVKGRGAKAPGELRSKDLRFNNHNTLSLRENQKEGR